MCQKTMGSRRSEGFGPTCANGASVSHVQTICIHRTQANNDHSRLVATL